MEWLLNPSLSSSNSSTIACSSSSLMFWPISLHTRRRLRTLIFPDESSPTNSLNARNASSSGSRSLYFFVTEHYQNHLFAAVILKEGGYIFRIVRLVWDIIWVLDLLKLAVLDGFISRDPFTHWMSSVFKELQQITTLFHGGPQISYILLLHNIRPIPRP